VVGSMTILLVLLGSIPRQSMAGPPFSRQANLTTIQSGATRSPYLSVNCDFCDEFTLFFCHIESMPSIHELLDFATVFGIYEKTKRLHRWRLGKEEIIG